MKKTLLAIIIALSILLPLCLAVNVSAEDTSVMIFDCDSAFSGFQSDKQNQTQGSACVRYDFSGGTEFVSSHMFSPVNGTGMKVLAMDVYVSEPKLIGKLSQLIVELSSAGTFDKSEIAWGVNQLARELKEGWNTVFLYFDEGAYTDGDSGRFDPSAINYLRIYAYYNISSLRGETLMFDNIRLLADDKKRYDGMSMDVYTGENGDVDVTIEGQSRESVLSDRDGGMTKASGHNTKDPLKPTEKDDKGGCGAVIAPAAEAALVSVLCVAGVLLRRKEK